LDVREYAIILVAGMLLSACGGSGSGSGAGTVDLTKHHALGNWKAPFDNSVYTMRLDGTYSGKEFGQSQFSFSGTWTASSLSKFQLSSTSYGEGVVVSKNRIEFPNDTVGTPTGSYTLYWIRL
jgi:hypothetical protein|tara:strand:+ start:300 stop:668 length:369 start_codon:yes stop_codon:yes gene_type:complete